MNLNWTNGFPYLVPVWHSLHYRDLYTGTENNIDPNLEIDIGGIGSFNDIHHKYYRRLPYKIKRHMLPFWVDSDRQNSKYSSNNCLTYDRKRNIFFSSKYNKLTGFKLNLDENRFDTNFDFNVNTDHRFSENESSSLNPFLYNIDNFFVFKDKINKNILEMKLYDCSNNLQLVTHSRKSLTIMDFSDDLKFETQFVIDSANLSSKNNLNFDCWDRNTAFGEDFLVTFLDDDGIFRINTVENSYSLEKNLGVDISENKNKFIGINWINELNPFTYFYGTHREICLGDVREDIQGKKKSSLSIVKVEDFIYYKQYELLQKFIPSLIDCHQLIAATDFNITFFDIRYLGRNIFQTKHMFTDELVRNLNLVELDPKSISKKFVLIASNSTKCCLYSFDKQMLIQPNMTHSPFYIDLPKQTGHLNNYLEFDYFIRGIQLLPNRFLEQGTGDDFFSVAVLLNNGDILMQDYLMPGESTKLPDDIRTDTDDFDEFQYENNYGNNFFVNETHEPVTKNYLEDVKNYLEKINSVNRNLCDFDLNSKNCRCCNVCCQGSCFRRKKNEPTLECLENSAKFCTCLNNSVEEELSLLEQESDNENEIVATRGCKVLDASLTWTDNDKIDFNVIRKNWFQVGQNKTDSNHSIRDICKPLTSNLFDHWCDILGKLEK